VPNFAAVLLSLSPWLGPQEPAPAPLRVRLFDLMDRAEYSATKLEDQASGAIRKESFDFDASAPAAIWFGRATAGGIEHGETSPPAVIVAGAGRAGAGLQLGPGVAEDLSQAVLLVPVDGSARVRIEGRVRLLGNPESGEASSREVLRVVEHRAAVADPRSVPRWARSSAATHRVSRRIDPSGWDRFELVFVAQADTRMLEIQLLHRSGGSGEAVTVYDDLEIASAKLGRDALYAHLRSRYRPRDGNAAASAWRLRVPLSDDGRRQEVRDAFLMPAPSRLALPLRLPAAESRPRLRFLYGMLPEAAAVGADGAVLQVHFEDEDGARTALGAVEVELGRGGGAWQHAQFDLTPVAGRSGRLVFASFDAPGGVPDARDAVLLATPRIEPAGDAPRAFNVLLIGVDTVRADRMSAFGYGRPTTPNLAALADAGVRFPRARSQAPWTLPSFSSILTSLYPSVHGAGRGGHDEWTPIDPGTTSIAEVLAPVGYETVGLVANGLISPQYGLDQGFESYRSAWSMESAEADSAAVATFVDGHRDTPWLMFWHIMDPHLPYSTSREQRDQFTEPGYDGQFSRGRGGQVPFQVLDPRPGRRWFAHEGPPPAPAMSAADARYVSDYYDAELAEMDAGVGRVLDALRASGQWERTIVAFIADHGEGLGDHGHYHHGYTLFEDQVHVPMLLRVPGQDEGRVVARPVAAIDLAPTILGALGMAPPEFFQGVDRLAAAAPVGGAYFIEYPSYDSSAQKAWIEGDFKYLQDPVFHTEALYHLGEDPREQRDVAAAHPGVVARARAALDEFRWEKLQKGRFHLRVRGRAGQRLRIAIRTDDLFDANFATRPIRPEADFAFDLPRQQLVIDTQLDGELLELVFWGRGQVLGFEAELDGVPLPGGVLLGAGKESGDADVELRIEDRRALPLSLEAAAIPRATGSELGWPKTGGALLWLESGFAATLSVLPTPAEIELLKQLGYAH